MKPAVAAVAVCLMIGCGGSAQVGDQCHPEGGMLCEDPATALECHSGLFRRVPCKGPGGCVSDGTRTACDEKWNLAGDPCTFAQEGAALCSVADIHQAFMCNSGVFSLWQTCTNQCVVTGGRVVCQ